MPTLLWAAETWTEDSKDKDSKREAFVGRGAALEWRCVRKSKKYRVRKWREDCWARIFSLFEEYNLQGLQSRQEESVEEEEMKQQQRMVIMKDLLWTIRSKGRTDAENRWWRCRVVGGRLRESVAPSRRGRHCAEMVSVAGFREAVQGNQIRTSTIAQRMEGRRRRPGERWLHWYLRTFGGLDACGSNGISQSGQNGHCETMELCWSRRTHLDNKPNATSTLGNARSHMVEGSHKTMEGQQTMSPTTWNPATLGTTF